MKVSKSIWDTRFTRAKPPMALDAAVVDALFALDDWITIHGAHVEIDGDGNVLHGAGGKFNGTNYYRHMNEKARKERENPAINFNAAEYKQKLNDYVDKQERQAEEDAEDIRKEYFERAENNLARAQRELNDAYAKYKTPRGYGKYEKEVEKCKDRLDKWRSPQELQQMADQYYMLGEAENGAKYDDYAKAAQERLEEDTKSWFARNLEDEFDKSLGNEYGSAEENNLDDIELDTNGSMKDIRESYIQQNTERVIEHKEREAAVARAEARIDDLYDEMRRNGGIPEGTRYYVDEDNGSIIDEDNRVIETPEQVTRGYNAAYAPENAGQKSIFGGSGWW